MNKMTIDNYAISATFYNRDDYAILNYTHKIMGRIIPKGFKWNGSSIPLFLCSLLMVDPFHPDVRLASLVHDYDYKSGKDRKEADQTYRDLWMHAGRNKKWYRRWTHNVRGHAMYIGLRIGGGKAYRDCQKDGE